MRKLLSVHKIGFRLLKMIHSADSTIIPLHLLDLCLALAQVYAGLFLTAELIDALLPGKYEQAAELALWLVGANLFLGTCRQLLRRRFKSSANRIWLIFYVWLREKAFSLDYETMEDPHVSEKILFSERTLDMYGGLGMLLSYYCSMLQALLNCVLSISLVFWLCMSRPAGDFGLLGRIAGPVPSMLLFAAVLTGMCFCARKVVVKYAAKQQEIFESHTGMENKLGY